MCDDAGALLRFCERCIGKLNKCYCVAPYDCGAGTTTFLVAAEQDDPCYLFDVYGTAMEKLWDAPGGVMSMVQLPDGDGRLVLATQQFYGPDCSENAKLVLAKALTTAPDPADPTACVWQRFVVAEMPFVHRFDVVPGRGAGDTPRYIIACTLKKNQCGAGDWSQPGQVLAARLPDDCNDLLPESWPDAADGAPPRRALSWRILKDGCLKNHGYCRHLDPQTGEVNCIIGCDAGIFLFRPPAVDCGAGEAAEDEWQITQLTSDPASDGTLVDLDGDGVEELVVISPFHGDTLLVYHADSNGAYECVYRHAQPLPFLHAIWGGELGGHSVAVLGHRAGERDLLLLSHSAAAGYHTNLIAHDCGPANATKIEYEDTASGRTCECIVSCNRETDTAMLYEVMTDAVQQ
ncbi:hypothetical protein NESM_000814200 [Novymonas esmeraldas]|uniref:Uncharacterized protein n=1 Tax=Novymonas esmeraldas TaxID=1808958 RepID=A0AAW0EXI1_9TRYP